MSQYNDILQRLGIASLNQMQQEAVKTIEAGGSTILLSPTGTGKTLAYLLPLTTLLKADAGHIQAVIIVPARELALQIGSVFGKMGTAFRAFFCYGGHAVDTEQRSLTEAPPDVLIGTPGRIVDHIESKSIDLGRTTTVVLDEFDKSLEFGFSQEMERISAALTSAKCKILTSATEAVEIPAYLGLGKAQRLNHINSDSNAQLTLTAVRSPQKDKLSTLLHLLRHTGWKQSIVFCNHRESVDRIVQYLRQNDVTCARFHGGMEQTEREKALFLFRGGAVSTIVSTDLAARGLDIPEVECIIHYHLPGKAEEFTHRNGRTARMHSSGSAFVILSDEDSRPDFLPQMETIEEEGAQGTSGHEGSIPPPAAWIGVYIGKGKRDKVSRGDVVGLFCKKGELTREELGPVEVKERYAMAIVRTSKVRSALKKIKGEKIKGMKTIFEEISPDF